MRIGQLAKRSGLSRDTIRFYERKGLIASRPEPNATNSYRDYPEDLLEALEWIAQAQAAGLTLDELLQLMRQMDGLTDDEEFDGLAFLDHKINETKARIAASQRFLRTLKQTREALERAPHMDRTSE